MSTPKKAYDRSATDRSMGRSAKSSKSQQRNVFKNFYGKNKGDTNKKETNDK